MTQIQPHYLWLGHAGDGRNAAEMFRLEIQAVVQLALEEPVLSLPREILYFRVPLIDGPGNAPELLALAVNMTARLVALKVPTLVCCGAGLSRSPAIAAAAL